ncbi:MAG: hypothetical protein AAGF47_00185 [Planctomycetota bacterium]
MTAIDHVTNAGALPSLAATIQFSARRQGMLAHNVANVSTPNFQQKDADVAGFQAMLSRAIDDRRARTGGQHGDLTLRPTRTVGFGPGGSMRLKPTDAAGRHGVLTHDRNNRDLERLMQDIAENQGVFRTATELMRNVSGTMRAAITERV